MRRAGVEAVLKLVNPLCEVAEEAQAHEVQMKVRNNMSSAYHPHIHHEGSGVVAVNVLQYSSCRVLKEESEFKQGDQLHDTWQRLGRVLSERVELFQTYVRVHTMALQVSDTWDALEAKVSDVNDDTVDVKDVQELWLSGSQKYVQFTHLAGNFMADALKVRSRFTRHRFKSDESIN